MTAAPPLVADDPLQADPDHEFFPTPEEGTLAFLAAMGWLSGPPPRRIWEPACGAGHLARVLEARGATVIGTDLHDRGYGRGGVDFLLATEAPARTIVTNPPWGKGEDFVRHALRFHRQGAVDLTAMVLRASFFNTGYGLAIYEAWPPARVMPITFRLDWLSLGGKAKFDAQWVIWTGHSPGPPPEAFRPLGRARCVDLLSVLA